MKNVHQQLQHTRTVTRMLLGNLHLTQELLKVNQLNTCLLKDKLKGPVNRHSMLNATVDFLKLPDTPVEFFSYPSKRYGRTLDENAKFIDWLKGQIPERQDSILGPERGKLLREGLLTPGHFMTLTTPPQGPSSGGVNPCAEQPLPGTFKTMLKGHKKTKLKFTEGKSRAVMVELPRKRILTPKKKGEILKFHEGASRTVTTIQPNGAYVTSKLTGVERAIYEMIFNQSPRTIGCYTLKARFCRHMKRLQPIYKTHTQKENDLDKVLASLIRKKLIIKPKKEYESYRLA